MIKTLLLTMKLDLMANRGNTKSTIVTLLFRLSTIARSAPFPLNVLLLPIRVFYKLLVSYIMGIDLPDTVKVGGGMVIFHGVGLVVHPDTVIGSNCILRHGVTLGNVKQGGRPPIIGDNVEFGCNCSVLGQVSVGSDAKIGAGAVVLIDVPAGCTAVGIPGRIV